MFPRSKLKPKLAPNPLLRNVSPILNKQWLRHSAPHISRTHPLIGRLGCPNEHNIWRLFASFCQFRWHLWSLILLLYPLSKDYSENSTSVFHWICLQLSVPSHSNCCNWLLGVSYVDYTSDVRRQQAPSSDDAIGSQQSEKIGRPAGFAKSRQCIAVEPSKLIA